MIGNEVVWAWLPVPRGKHGDPGTGTPVKVRIPGCVLYPRGSTEANGRESTVIVGMTLLAPLGSDITSKHMIDHRGTTYRVEGKPGEWRFLDSADAALEVALEEATD